MDRGIGDGSINDLPWASVFDPSANARALSAIQAEGFHAASALVDRFARIATNVPNGKVWPTRPTAPLTNEQRADLFGATDVEPLIRSWWSMIGQALLGTGSLNSAVAEGVTLDLASSKAEGRLDLQVTVPGVAAAEVWLHNRSADDFGDVRLRCSDLMAHDGNLIRSDEVKLEPHVVAMPPRCSRGIAIEVNVSQGIRPGVYRGNLLAEENSDLWLPVVLTVRAPAS